MASQTAPLLLVEIAPHSLQLVSVDAGGKLAGVRKCAVAADAVAAALGELSITAPAANVQALLMPTAGFVLRSNAEEAAAMRTAKTLLTRAETAAGDLLPPLHVMAFDSANGRRVETVGSAPWVLTGTTSEQIDGAKEKLRECGLAVGDIGLALPVRIGAVVAALQDMPESTRVLVWDLGEADSQLACVSAGGCEAAGTVPVGFNQIFEAVQASLGLKFRAAAAKLFFNDGYDFSETAGPIAERIAALLRPAISNLGCAPTTLYVSGLPAGQAWLEKAVTSALELAPLAPDMAAFCAQRGLTGPAVNADLPVSALGLLFKASSGGDNAQAWHPAWLDANAPVPAPAAPAPAPTAKSAPAPAPKAAAPAPEVKAPAEQKPAPAPKAPAPAPVPVASGAASAPAKAPVAPVAPVAAAPAQATPAPVVPAPAAAPAPETKPVAKPVAPAAKPITPAPVIKPAAAAPATPAPAAVPVAAAPATPAAVIPPANPVVTAPVAAESTESAEAEAAPAEVVEAAPKKNSVALFAGIAGFVVLGAVGAFLLTGGSDEADNAEAAAPVAESHVDQRLREEEYARMLAEELKTPRSFRNDRYSFEVSDRGFLRKLVGVGNRTIIDELGWLELQGIYTGTAKVFNLGTINDSDYVATINKTVRDGRVVFEISGKHPRFALETTMTCNPTTLHIHTVFTPINLEDARGRVEGVYKVQLNRQSLTLGQRAEVSPGGVSYSTQSGPFVLKFNDDAWGQAGDADKQTVSVGSNLVFFYFSGGNDPKHNVLTAELTLP